MKTAGEQVPACVCPVNEKHVISIIHVHVHKMALPLLVMHYLKKNYYW